MADSNFEAEKSRIQQEQKELILRYEKTAKQLSAKLRGTVQHQIDLCISNIERAQAECTASSTQELQKTILSMNNLFNDIPKPLTKPEGDRNRSKQTMNDLKDRDAELNGSDWTKFPLIIFTRVKDNIHDLQRESKAATTSKLCNLKTSKSKAINKERASKARLYTCRLCGKSYTWKTSMYRHIHYKHEKRPKVFCFICKKEFSRVDCLKRHWRGTHSGGK